MNERFGLINAQRGTPANIQSGWVVQVDFDGTISNKDVIDTLLERYGTPGWRELEAAWERGEIGSHECMRNQVALLDMSLDELHTELANVAVDPDFARFVTAVRRQGIGVQIVSDGLDYAILVILRNNGLTGIPVIANHLQTAGARGWRLGTPWARPTCRSANCKCSHLEVALAAAARVLYIGDGRSDFCVAGRADFVFAKSSLLTHCQSQHIRHAAFKDFNEVLALLPGVLGLAGSELTP